MQQKVMLSKIDKEFSTTKSDRELFKLIVNDPFRYKLEAADMSLGIIALLFVNKKSGTIDGIALTENEIAESMRRISAKKCEDIKVLASDKTNIIAQAIRSGHIISTTDWKYLFTPELTDKEARFCQAGGGIGFSVVFPLKARNKGALVFNYYESQEEITEEQYEFIESYGEMVDKALS